MNNSEYEQKRRECWEEFQVANRTTLETTKQAFEYIFDRAYALGKQETKQETKPFGISEQLNAEETVISGWVARDKEGYLVLHYKEPHRTLGNTKWYSAQSQKSLPRDTFPDLTWDSDPEEVEITIKRKKK